MKTYLVALSLLSVLLFAGCQQTNPDYERPIHKYKAVDIDSVGQDEKVPDGYGSKAFVTNETNATTKPAHMRYDTKKAAIVWDIEVSLTGAMPKKVVVIASFRDEKGNVILIDKADAVVLAPGEKKVVKHEAEISKENAAKIASWGIDMEFAN
jgi:hypothetical protein